MIFSLQVLLAAGCLLAIGDLLVHIAYSFIALKQFETLPTFRVLPPREDGPVWEPLEIPTTDNLKLRGGIYFPEDGHARGVVIFCPETGGSFETATNYVESLIDAGFAVLSFSFRNQSPSDSLPGYRSSYWVTQYEVDDVQAAIKFVSSQPQFAGLPIGLVGISRGAGAALAAAARRPEVNSVWTQGAFSTEGLSMHHAMKFVKSVIGPFGRLVPVWHVRTTIWFMLRLAEIRNRCRLIKLEPLLPRLRNRHVMFVSGSRDTYVPNHINDELRRLTGHRAETAQWIVPQAKHNLERATAPREFDQRIVRFFEQMLPVEQRSSAAKAVAAK